MCMQSIFTARIFKLSVSHAGYQVISIMCVVAGT